mmetsp:Transcript_28977/g.33089  ORF Transcript_28977/g.33089 Transcript_28977/m.33089 type:complete len:84 (+) Transcript_28977:415-666(+)
MTTFSYPYFTYEIKPIKYQACTLENIRKFIGYMYERVGDDQCLIPMQIYTERLLDMNGIVIDHSNWRPILLTAFMIALKYVND